MGTRRASGVLAMFFFLISVLVLWVQSVCKNSVSHTLVTCTLVMCVYTHTHTHTHTSSIKVYPQNAVK